MSGLCLCTRNFCLKSCSTAVHPVQGIPDLRGSYRDAWDYHKVICSAVCQHHAANARSFSYRKLLEFGLNLLMKPRGSSESDILRPRHHSHAPAACHVSQRCEPVYWPAAETVIAWLRTRKDPMHSDDHGRVLWRRVSELQDVSRLQRAWAWRCDSNRSSLTSWSTLTAMLRVESTKMRKHRLRPAA